MVFYHGKKNTTNTHYPGGTCFIDKEDARGTGPWRHLPRPQEAAEAGQCAARLDSLQGSPEDVGARGRPCQGHLCLRLMGLARPCSDVSIDADGVYRQHQSQLLPTGWLQPETAPLPETTSWHEPASFLVQPCHPCHDGILKLRAK